LKHYADTSFLIAIVRGKSSALEAIKEISGPIYIPTMAYYEFYVGIAKGEMKYGERFSKERAFIESFPLEEISDSVLRRAAEIRATAEAHGLHASDADYIIIAQAEENAGKIITADEDILRIVKTLKINVEVKLLR